MTMGVKTLAIIVLGILAVLMTVMVLHFRARMTEAIEDKGRLERQLAYERESYSKQLSAADDAVKELNSSLEATRVTSHAQKTKIDEIKSTHNDVRSWCDTELPLDLMCILPGNSDDADCTSVSDN